MRARTIRTRTIFSRTMYVKVDSSAASLSVPWDDRLDEIHNHRAAMWELVSRLGWEGRYVHGQIDTTCNVFVSLEPDNVVGAENA